MRAGECQGVDRSGPTACVNPYTQGQAVNFRMPRPRIEQCLSATFGPPARAQVVLLTGAEVVCPWCLINRMRNAGLITPAVAQEGREYASVWHCVRYGTTGHTHRFPIGNLDQFWECEDGDPPMVDVGYG